jgi:dipeptidyl aminopeptidase/acylaminoacyl peptidase
MAQDLVGLARLGGPVVSPDGQRVVYTLRETDVVGNKSHTEVYVLDLKSATAAPQRLTNAPQSSSQPHWSADSTAVYFLSARSGLSQVWRISLKGGEATPVTQFPVDIESYTLSPNEDRLLFSAGVFPDCGDLLCTQKRLSDAEKSATHARTFDQLMVRHWDTWADGRRSELFGASLDAAAKPGRSTHRGPFTSVPSDSRPSVNA